MKTNAKKLSSFLLCAVELVVGVLLLIKPVAFTSALVICCGVGIMARGLFDIVFYFRLPALEAAQNQRLSRGLGEVLLGAFCTFGYRWLMAVVPFLGVVEGILLLLLGIHKVQVAVDQCRFGMSRWYLMGISALLSLICGVIILFNPFAAAAGVWIFAGVALIVEAIADLISLLMNHVRD
ncbi:MAG: DUF308 domain-containing protein [Clostridia bacterium]|nr:DUF308 domain-containing protein [Clostridia bacterium]MDD6041202.1 DUF308 domain-containing protein [Clostridia bacterium]